MNDYDEDYNDYENEGNNKKKKKITIKIKIILLVLAVIIFLIAFIFQMTNKVKGAEVSIQKTYSDMGNIKDKITENGINYKVSNTIFNKQKIDFLNQSFELKTILGKKNKKEKK